MTTPTILPTGFDGTSKDYLHAKVERDGCLRAQYSTVTIPATTASAVVVGIVPFQKGFRMGIGGTQLAVADLDTATTVTMDFGYVYATGSSETDDPNAFATLLTTPQAGGFVTFDEAATALPWVAADNGWIVAVVQGGPTTTSGAVYGQVVGCYDGLNAAN